MSPRRAEAAQNPGNWPLQFAVQDAIRARYYLGREWDHALRLYRTMEDRTLGELLEARLLIPVQRKRSGEMLDRLSASASDSPWFHLARLEWGIDPKDGYYHAGSSEAFKALRRLCPESLRAFAHVDAGTGVDRMTAMRRLIDAAKSRGEAILGVRFFSLWLAERPANSAVRSDLEYLRRMPQYGSLDWYHEVRSGYDHILNEPGSLTDFENEILDRAPDSRAASVVVMQRLATEPAKRGTWMLELANRFFGRPFVAVFAYGALESDIKLSHDEVVRLANFVLTSADRFPDELSAYGTSYSVRIAEVYAKRKVKLDDVPVLVAKGLEEVEYQQRHSPGRDDVRFGNYLTAHIQSRAREATILHAAATGDTKRAELLIADLRAELEQTRGTGTESEWRKLHSRYLELAGKEAKPLRDPAPSIDQRERYVVADFVAKDLSGKTWRLADLKGKVTFVYTWTAWCARCVAEMPIVEKLHQRWKNRPDRLVLTIAADRNPPLVESFLRGNKYSFPVIPGQDVAEKFFPTVRMPQSWIIDPQGRRLTYEPLLGDGLEEVAAKLR